MDDITSGQDDEVVRVEATFTDIDEADKRILGRYASRQVATFQRSCHYETGLRSDFENKLETVLTERYEPMRRADATLSVTTAERSAQ